MNNSDTKNLNEKFKTITTWDEFEQLKNEMDDYGSGYWFFMTTKKGGKLNGIWNIDGKRVVYITDQTSIEYKCQIKNLHRFMKIG